MAIGNAPGVGLEPRVVGLARPDIGPLELELVTQVLNSDVLALGPFAVRFEAAAASLAGRRYAVACSSGTAALHMGVRALGIGRGDEALTTPFSFIASANCLLYEGAIPRFVDIEEDSLGMDPDLVEAAASDRTRAMVPVHVFGRPCRIDRLVGIAREHGWPVIEDACEGVGSSLGGKPLGSFGDVAAFAFYPNKQITTGEGGMALTDDPAVAEMFRSLRNQGRDTDGTWLRHVRLGYNYRLDELSAALGVAQLERFEQLRSGRARVVARYERALAGRDWGTLPRAVAGEIVDWFVYVVRLDASIDRDAVVGRLADRGVQARPYFAPLHLQPFYRAEFGYKPGDFPVTERVATSTLALPFSSRLPDEDVDYVAAMLEEAVVLKRSASGRTPVFVVSGHTMALAVVRALGENGIPVAVLHYDARDTAQESRYAVADIRIPHPLVDEGAFVDAIVHHAGRYGRPVLMPASDESVVAISRNRDRLAECCEVACPEWSVTERFIDKARTCSLAQANGVPAPRTAVPTCLVDMEAQANSLGFPLLLKPAESHLYFERFKRKMVRVTDMSTLRKAYCEAIDAGLSMTLQEIIPGDDSAVVNYNSYTWDGRPVAEFTARQLRKAPPAFGSPRVARSERIPEVIEPGRKILAAMGFSGFSCTEFKQDSRDGVYKLMEVNGRHNLSGLLAVRCGMNFPLIQYRHLTEGVLPVDCHFRAGIYWTDFFRDAGYSAAYVRTERHSPAAYMRPYARRQCDAIFDPHDIGPFWARFKFLAGNAVGSGRKSLLGK